jgi:uroporphyrinogen-III decarboxylase
MRRRIDRQYFLDLASQGARFPIAADLVLHEQPNVDDVLLDGVRLGKVLEETARRYHTTLGLALGLMDLTVEKQLLLERLGVPRDEVATFHFTSPPTDAMLDKVRYGARLPPRSRLRANLGAIEYLATQTDLVPIGMSIGPFSLMTKLFADPITPVYLAGSGVSADEDDEVKAIERALDMSLHVVSQTVELLAGAGAEAIFIAEPAANKVYFSPNQIVDQGSDVFERFALAPNRRIKQKLDELHVQMLFHCCGELVDPMVSGFASLHPALLSLGSSRKLWEDARLVSGSTVLYGNLPSKRFWSDDLITVDEVRRQSRELLVRMRQANHPFILGTECDVLSVPGAQKSTTAKVDAMMTVMSE